MRQKTGVRVAYVCSSHKKNISIYVCSRAVKRHSAFFVIFWVIRVEYTQKNSRDVTNGIASTGEAGGQYRVSGRKVKGTWPMLACAVTCRKATTNFVQIYKINYFTLHICIC